MLTPVLQDFYTFFGASSDVQVPYQLGLRNQNTLWFAMIGLSLSFILLAITRLTSANLVITFGKILGKNSTISKTLKEEYSLTSLASFLLLLNFVITTTVLLYLSYLHFNIENKFDLFYIFPLIPLYFFVWPIICFNLVGFITNEQKLLKENKQNNIVITQIIGVLFSLLLLIWAFNMQWSQIFILIFNLIIVIFWVFKIFRGIIFSIENGISLYYIILYFCTLEILPLILLYSLYLGKIKEIWLYV